ncbi:MAG TPA: aromatic ring-hydroxylating dioxygenase subunit alpha [Chitinophagaceae bacterium]|nr:aromatic ring-hydroxylating dioxygenase subunit alpha [Chitinophagaceae bacterium]
MQPVNADISLARTLDTAFYNDPQLQTAIRDQIFVPSWQYIGDARHVSEPGSCYPFTLLPGSLDEPLLLTRDEAGIHCLSNVCTHRGNILVNKPCRSAQLRCTYHGRQFSLNGQFRSMPEFKEVKDFPAENDHLPKLPVFNWGQMLFTSLQGSLPATSYLGDMIKRLEWLPVEEFIFRPDLSREFPVKAHWALYCENYLEGFHIPFVHAGLNAVIDYGNYTTELFALSNLQLGIAKDDEDCFDLPPGSPDHGRKVAAYYFFVFPNMMFNFYPWGLSINIVEPNGLEQTKVRFLTYMWKEHLYNTGAGSGLDTVEFEDEEVVENVQRGVKSRFYKFGRYSVTREQGTHHFHRMISAAMKPWNK